MQPISNLHDWLSYLPSTIRQEVKRAMKTIVLLDGENIYAQHDAPQNLYQIEQGKVRACNYSEKGKEIVYAIFNPGDCFGELSLIDGEPRHSHMFALGATTLNVLHKSAFTQLYNQHIEIPQSLNLMLSKRLRFAFAATENFTLLSLRERLAHYLISIAVQSPEFHEKQRKSRWIIDITQENLSKMLFTSRQSVSKELKYFESIQAIEIKYGKIYLVDMDKLTAS